jgi:hypothetical protein
MKECDALREDLKAYADGELGSARHQEIERHLDSCEACREEVAAMNRISHEFFELEGKAESESFDPALRARILAGLPELQPGAVSARPSLRQWWRRPMLGLAGVAAVAVIAVILWDPQSQKVAGNMRMEAAKSAGGGGGGMADRQQVASNAPAFSASGGSPPRQKPAAAASVSPASPSGGGMPSSEMKMAKVEPQFNKLSLEAAKAKKPLDSKNASQDYDESPAGVKLARRAKTPESRVLAMAPGKRVHDGLKGPIGPVATLPLKADSPMTLNYDAGKLSSASRPGTASHASVSAPVNQEVVVVVDKLDEKKAALLSLIKEAGGTAETKAENRASNNGPNKTNAAAIMVQIPSAKVDETIANVKRLGEDEAASYKLSREPLGKTESLIQNSGQNAVGDRAFRSSVAGQGGSGRAGSANAGSTRENAENNRDQSAKRQIRGKTGQQLNQGNSQLQQNATKSRAAMPLNSLEPKPAVTSFTIRLLEKQKVAPAMEPQQKK